MAFGWIYMYAHSRSNVFTVELQSVPCVVFVTTVVLYEVSLPPSRNMRVCITEDIHKISSLTKDTHRDTCLLMETTTRWVPQNPKQLREDTLAHSGYPYESHGIKFPQLPLLGTSSDAFSLPLSHHRSSPPPALSRHRRLPPIRRRCSLLSPSLTRRGSLPHPLSPFRHLSLAAARRRRRRRVARGLRWPSLSSPPRASLAPPPLPTSVPSPPAVGGSIFGAVVCGSGPLAARSNGATPATPHRGGGRGTGGGGHAGRRRHRLQVIVLSLSPQTLTSLPLPRRYRCWPLSLPLSPVTGVREGDE